MKTFASIASILLLSFGLSACNTMQGLGQDIERGGEKLENSAERQQRDMQTR